MKRREFLAGLGSASAVPLIPAKALSGAFGATHVPELYATAAKWARIWEQSSVTMLKSQFQLDSRTANHLFDRLVADRIVGAPDASGMARVAASSIEKALAPERIKKVFDQQQTTKPIDPQQPDKTAEVDTPSDVADVDTQELDTETQASHECDDACEQPPNDHSDISPQA
jgi:hypothetical protein